MVGESLIPRVMDHFDEAGLFEALDSTDLKRSLVPVLLEVKKFVFLISAINLVKDGIGRGKFQEPISTIAMTDELQVKGLILNLKLKLPM